MQKQKRRKSDRSGRPKMRSPGRPPEAGLEQQKQFWRGIAEGLSSEEGVVVGAGRPTNDAVTEKVQHHREG